MYPLKYKIEEHLERSRINLANLSQQTGIAYSVLFKILDEKVEEPTAKTLIKIADALNCSVDELLGRKFVSDDYITSSYEKVFSQPLSIEEVHILNEVADKVNKSIVQNKLMIPINKIMEIIQEVFEYSTKTTPYFVDERFIKWILSKKSS